MATVDNYGNECADLRAEVEALRAQVPPAEVVEAIRRIYEGTSGKRTEKLVYDWLYTLPTQEAQP